MTDASLSQLAVVAVTRDAPAAGSILSQLAMIAVVGETPPTAGGAVLSQVAFVAVSIEVKLTRRLSPFPIRSVWGFPYYIERTRI